MLTALLNVYFYGQADNAWIRYKALLMAFYVQLGITDGVRRRHYLHQVTIGVSQEIPVDWSLEPLDNRLYVAANSEQPSDLSDMSILHFEIGTGLGLVVRAIINSSKVRTPGGTRRSLGRWKSS